ncbi:MAG: hypothetical protein H8E82_07065 [Candidatus Marinimicrobia bacterium]|nr:hypothetical protein [Candidatus Neomarinimicrobiota bacterium]
MKSMKNIFKITVDDVQYISRKKIGRNLTIEELEKVQKGVEFGLELSWMEVIEDSIDELRTVNRDVYP